MIGAMEEKIETCMHKMDDVLAILSLRCIKVLTLIYDRCGILSGRLVYMCHQAKTVEQERNKARKTPHA